MLAFAAVAVSTIWVSSPEPVPSCQLAPEVAGRLQEMVPAVRVELAATGSPGEGDATLTVEGGEAGQLRVVLRDAGGAELMVRAMPVRGTCEELGLAAAMFVERYLNDVDWRPDGISMGAGLSPDDVLHPAPPSEPGVSETVAPRAIAAGAPIRGEVMARGLVALGPTQAGADVAVMAGRRALRVGVELGAMWPRDESVVRDGGAMIGEIRMSSLHVLGGAGVARGRAAAALWAGGERVGAAAAGNAVFQRADQAAWQVLVRGDLGYGVPVTGRLSVRVAAGVEWRPQPVEIQVEGASRGYASPGVRAVLGAGVTWRFR